MFESCNNLDELNRLRLEEIRNGNPAAVVNKEYAKRKTILLSTQQLDYKRLRFVTKAVVPKVENLVGITDVYWDETDPYKVYVEE